MLNRAINMEIGSAISNMQVEDVSLQT